MKLSTVFTEHVPVLFFGGIDVVLFKKTGCVVILYVQHPTKTLIGDLGTVTGPHGTAKV